MHAVVKKSMWTLAGLLAVFGLACVASGPNPTPTPEDEVLFFQKSAEACEWTIWDPATGETRIIEKTAGCPSEVLFDSRDRRTVSFLEDKLYEKDWAGESRERTVIAEVPKDAQGLRLWISGETGRIRFAYLAQVEDSTVELEGAPHRLLLAADPEIYRFEGQDYPRTEGLPPWGMPYMAVLLQLGKDGRWVRLALAPTKGSAGDTPGLDVLREHFDDREGVFSLRRSLLSATCAEEDCQPDWDQREEVFRRLGSELGIDSADSLGDRSVGTQSRVLFSVEWGDLPTAVGPVFWCEGECRSVVRLDDLPQANQLSISVRGNLILVTEEGTGSEGRVYRAGDAKPIEVFSGSEAAVWIARSALPPQGR